MEKFRINNDLSIFWSITEKNGSPYTLSDKTVRLFVTHPRGRMDVTSDITIQDNVICWLFRGSKQRYLGTYKITVEIQATPADRIIRKDIPEAFALVSSTQYEQTEIGRPDINETGELTLATSLDIFQIYPIIPQVGPNRNWWVDGVDTGKSSVGLTAYEFAKENGYTGTEEEYAAECLSVPALNEEARTAIEEANNAAEVALKAAEDITKTYITDFTVIDLNEALRGNPKQFEIEPLKNALAKRMTILVPFGADEVKGYSLLQGYYEDLLYFTVKDERDNAYVVETNLDAQEIFGENIVFVRPIDHQYEISVLKEQVKNINPAPMISVAYAELVALRDNGKLVAGMQYRITDYATTTEQKRTRSAGHQFDVIVTADNENTLNEVARACLHEGDTYFSEAGANLAAWQIWYSLDNDVDRFVWADATNGKGVIYRMIDEWNNDCPYDFKNIKFYYNRLETDVYTFTWIDDSYNVMDASVFGNNGTLTYNGEINGVYGNVIKPIEIIYDEVSSEYLGIKHSLNNITFISDSDYELNGNDGFYGCHNNNFGNGCFNNSFGNKCHSNRFGNRCHSNSFGNGCFNNRFGNGCFNNSLGNGCNSNSFGINCYSNSFGDNCDSNSFGNGYNSNSFGINCYYNSFGDDCNNNSLGDNCNYNSFGNGCNNNSFGDNCNYNSFGNGCWDIDLHGTDYRTASVNSNGEVKVFNLADLAI